MGAGKISHANDRHHLPATPLVARRSEVLVSTPASLGFAGLNELHSPFLNTAGGLAGAEWAVHQPPIFCPLPSTSHLHTLFFCFIVQVIFSSATYLKHRFTYFSSTFSRALLKMSQNPWSVTETTGCCKSGWAELTMYTDHKEHEGVRRRRPPWCSAVVERDATC